MISPDSRGLVYWPGLPVLRSRSRLVFFFVGFFYLFYGGASWLADFLPWRFSVVFAWEKNIPFLPATAILYTSISWLMLLTLFVIRDEKDLRQLLRVFCLQTVIGSLLFILLPISNGFPAHHANESLPLVFVIADTMNLHNNELPSLHVCFAFTTAVILSHYAGKWQALWIYTWASVIAVSAITIHEHTLADLGGGMLLAAWGVRFWRGRVERIPTVSDKAISEYRDFGLGRALVQREGLRPVQRDLLNTGAIDDTSQAGTKS